MISFYLWFNNVSIKRYKYLTEEIYYVIILQRVIIMKAGKVWGDTVNIFSNHNFEFHRIQVKKGGYCSKHKHLHKFNGFYIER